MRGYDRESLAAQTHGGAWMLDKLSTAKKVVGIKQVRRAVKDGQALAVYLADDADPQLTQPLERACEDAGIRVVLVKSMKELGAACGIAVGSACAAEIR